MYINAPTNSYYNPTISIERGKAVVQIPVKPEFFHAGSAVHGSVYFKALDDAAYFAVNSLVEDCMMLTVSFTTHMIRPITGGVIRAEGTVVQYGKRVSFAEAVLYDARNKICATGNGSFVKSELQLTDAIGYRSA